MSCGQVQLVKWSLPAFALILGLLWYKRRRVDRVDPGGATKSQGDTKTKRTSISGSSPNGNLAKASSLCDSGIHTDDSFSLNASSSTPTEEVISPSPRKVSESLDIPNRKSSSQSISMLSCKSIELSNTPWYDVQDSTPEMREIVLGSNPTKNGFDYMSKSKTVNNNAKTPNKMDNVIEEVQAAKVVVANNEQSKVQQTELNSSCEKPAIDDHHANGDEKKQRQVLSERDSANHSPVSGVLEGSVTDEARSEGSTDSGKGGSIKSHPKDSSRTFYEFSIPSKHVGKLIGRSGKFLQHVRNTADVGVVVKRHPTERDCKICRIDGTPEGITTALEIIRQNFPEKTYPHLTLEQIDYDQILAPEEIPWVPELMQLSLVEGVNNDVIVSHIIKPNHLFIQLPTHPTYPSLRILDEKMTQLYETVESPPIPDELSKGMIVVAKWYDKWVRVCIENPDPKGEQTLARMVDHGGYWTFSNSDMRKIRSDYLTLPFQAIEVFLANIQPKEGEWSQEAFNIVAQICSGIVGQAQIVGYADCSTFINLYFNIHKHGVISIADELIAREMAEPMSLEEVLPQEVLPSV